MEGFEKGFKASKDHIIANVILISVNIGFMISFFFMGIRTLSIVMLFGIVPLIIHTRFYSEHPLIVIDDNYVTQHTIFGSRSIRIRNIRSVSFKRKMYSKIRHDVGGVMSTTRLMDQNLSKGDRAELCKLLKERIYDDQD